ncbi:MAG: ABC transporter permease [Verrucomicrobia bacterium]|nr:ABC transporter permease [Verrucomicrobiota bacterium]
MKLKNELSESFRIAFDAINANKMRSILTTLGIVIGVVTVSLMSMAIDGVSKSFVQSISVLGSDILYIEKESWMDHSDWWKRRGRRDIELNQAKELVRLAGDRYIISPYVSHQVCTVKYGSESITGVFMDGGSAAHQAVNQYTFSEGRFFDENEVNGSRPVCVLGYDAVHSLFKGDSAIGKKVKLNDITYEVIGAMEKRGTFMGFSMDNTVYVPVTRMLSDFANRPNVSILVKAPDMKNIDEMTEEIRGLMRKVRHLQPGEEDDFAINKQGSLIDTFNKVNRIISSCGLFITGLSLFVGGIGIMNIMFVSVAERTKEIGLRKALGARRRTILLQFMLEALLICLFGGIIGLLIACAFQPIVSIYIPASISLKTVAIALLIAAATGVISGYIPARRAALMDPVDSLRND